MKTRMMEMLGRWYKVADSGTYYDQGTPDKVVDELEYARQAGYRIRVVYGDAKTGRAWLEELDILGSVGRSSGIVKAPLLLARRNCVGGDAILTASVVGIKRAGRGGAWLYRHPALYFPVLDHRPVEDEDLRAKGYVSEVITEDESKEGAARTVVQARFKTTIQAVKFIKFLRAERDSK